MSHGITTVAGITVLSADPLFLSIVALHVPLGLLAATAGAIAMLSPKRPGRHPLAGTCYFWSILGVFVTATALSLVRWAEDYPLFVLGTLSFLAASAGRAARQRRIRSWATLHVIGMGTSYVLLLTAFYVDNGRQLPLWRELPTWVYWTLPTAAGAPLLLWALLNHPVVRGSNR